MLLQESLSEHNSTHDTTDELDETLSLCDLPLYGDQSVEDWVEPLYTDSQGSTSFFSSSSQHHYFEFFTHQLIPSAACSPPENIIFCGKIIPYRKPDASDTIPSKELESQEPTTIKKKRGWRIFRWRIGSRTGNMKSTTLMQKQDHHQTSNKTYNDKKKLPLHKMPILTSSSSSSGKARWYLFLTGISRFSSGMELKDIKSRQSRRHIHSPPQSPTLRVQNQDAKVTGRTTSAGSSRLWEVIRVLSCGGNHHPNAMVVRSIRRNRLE